MRQSDLFVDDKWLAERYGLKRRQTIHDWARKGYLPKPVKLTPGCSRWRWSEIEAFEQGLEKRQ